MTTMVIKIPIEKLLAISFLVPMDDPNSNYCRWGLNLMLWGDPGIGKSDRVDTASAMVGLPPRTVYAATTQPEDVSGAAFPNTTKAVAMIEAALEAVHELAETSQFGGTILESLMKVGQPIVKKVLSAAKRYGGTTTSMEPLLPGITDLMIDQQGVLFLDELSCARPAVQGAYLGVVLSRKVGGKKLPPGIRIVAAANPPESAAGGWELEPPMANRFCHIDVSVPSIEEWAEWLINETGAKLEAIEDGEEKIRNRWPDEWPIVKGQIVGYMRSVGKEALHKMPPEGHKNRGRAWPSPRTWYFAGKAIATCRCLNAEDIIRDTFIEGCVGEGQATAFTAWVKNADLPTPQEMIKNGWPPDKRRLDRTIAAYTSLISYVKERPDHKEKLEMGLGAWKCVAQSADAGMLDITLPMAQGLVRAGLDTKSTPEIADVAKPVLSRLAKAGMAAYLRDGA